MPICPRGHDSTATDYCDECGRRIEQPGAAGAGPFAPVGAAYPPPPEQRCLACDTPRTGDWRYCEACGHEFPEAGAASRPQGGYQSHPGHRPIPPQTPPPPAQPPAQPPGYPQPVRHPGGGAEQYGGGYGQRPMAQQPPAPQQPDAFDPWARSRPSARTSQPPASPAQAAPAQPAPMQSPPPAPAHPGYGDRAAHDPGYGDRAAHDPGYGDPAAHDPGYVEPPPAPRYGGNAFAEAPPPATREVWTVVVTADQEYFQRVVAQGGPDAHSMRFPPYYEPWSVELRGERMRVGRRRNNDNGAAPEIDLTGPPGDPGISHLHCVLIERPDGSWMLVDPGSRNGTTFNGGTDAVEVNVPVELRDGDCVHVGAWTTLQVRVTRR